VVNLFLKKFEGKIIYGVALNFLSHVHRFRITPGVSTLGDFYLRLKTPGKNTRVTFRDKKIV